MSDSISRQAALDIFDDYNVAVENGQIEAYSRDRKRLCDLPPAQPEQNFDEWCTDCKEYDKEKHSCPRWNRVIRQTLQDAQPELCEDDPRADVYYLAEKIGIHQLYALVVQLRGEPEPCDDAVSREAVIDVFYELWGTSLTRTVDAIKQLPPVTPKQRTGHWINKSWHGENTRECSACNVTQSVTVFGDKVMYKYCPYCGGRRCRKEMRSELQKIFDAE